MRDLVKLNAGIPAALSQEHFRIGHLQNLAQGISIIRRVFVVRLDNTVSDSVAKVALFCPRFRCRAIWKGRFGVALNQDGLSFVNLNQFLGDCKEICEDIRVEG